MSHILNRNDIPGLKKWFEDHKHLSTNDLAQLADCSSWRIRRLKKLAGIKGQPTKPTPRYRPPPSVMTMDIPDDWRNDIPWLTKAAKLYSVSAIAKAVGRDPKTVYDILLKRGIKVRDHKEACKSKNKCCTHSWCYQHYMLNGLTQAQCAELAGISVQVFSDWLNRFKIPVRDVEQAVLGRTIITLWEKKLIAGLRQQPTVRRVYVREGYIHVRFMNYFWENYYTRPASHMKRPYTYFALTEDNSRLRKVPLVHYEFDVGIDGKPLHPAHISLNRAEFKAANMIEQRLAIHEYARQLVTRGWIQPTYPDEVLRNDLQKIETIKPSDCIKDGGFSPFAHSRKLAPIGRRLMMNFFDCSVFHTALRRPMVAVRSLNTLTSSAAKFNFYNLLMTVANNAGSVIKGRIVPSMPNPVVYAAMFRELKLSGTLLDVSIGLGNRAVAAAAAGLTYCTADPMFQQVIDRGFLDFTGLNYEKYDGQMVDTVIYDNGFRVPEMERVMPYLGKAKKLLVFCPFEHAQEMQRYKPQTAIRIRTRFFRKLPDYVFVW